ncbi:MAG: HD-GYP domain-containing protein [Candidatus Gastranaerophilaceae bacterium]
MNFEGLVKNTYPINVVRPYETVRDTRIQVPNTPDKVSLNGALDKYLDRNTLLAISYSNPEIAKMLAEKGVPLNFNIENFKKNVYNHSIDTKNTAIGIYNNLPSTTKNMANVKDISDGALLHDLGKILIPENILSKRNKLSPKELDIMQMHSNLSYELLKNQGFNNNVLNIIKYHHQNPSHTGYPLMPESQAMDINTQIVSLADKYSALREKRSYKPQINQQDALNILYKEMNQGVSPDVYNALTNYVNSSNNKTKNTSTLTNYLDSKNIAPQINRNATFYA